MNNSQKKWLPIALCLLFIVAWQYFVVRPYMQKQKEQQQSSETSTAADKSLAPAPTGSQLALTPLKEKDKAASDMTVVLSREELKKNATKLALNSKRTVEVYPNGGIGSALFQDYKTRHHKNDENVNILKDGFVWSSTDARVGACLARMKIVEKKDSQLVRFASDNGKEKCTLSYIADSARAGLVGTQLSLTGFEGSAGTLELRASDDLGEGLPEDHNYLSYKLDGSSTSVRESDLHTSEVKSGKIDWLLWGDKYFASILIPKGNFNPNVVYGSARDDAKKVNFGFQYPLVFKGNETSNYEVELYLGTRDGDELMLISPTLADTVDLGFFRSVARLMLWALKSLNQIFANFGVSIVALTILVRVLFWPLNRKVFLSGKKMKELQPKIEALKAKYGKDKSQAEQMNRELIGLYKTHKVNPLGSCLPLLLQMPIFLGLYGALNHSLDLYQAPFFGWIHDLSSPDPFFVFPILWTLTLLAYMKLNPTPAQPGGPDMKWMMIGMNLFFGYLSRNWPAGLTLYLFVSNLVGITQQFAFQRATKLQPIQEGA